MKWKRASRNYVEDRRGAGGLGGLGGGGLSIPIPGGGAGLGGGVGIIVVLIFLALQLFGGGLLGGDGGGASVPDPGGIQAPPANGAVPQTADDEVAFIQAVVEDVQGTWSEAFNDAGRDYEETTLVLFDGGTQTGCGSATSAVGPFYCPADHKVYLDLSFFRELSQRFGAPGDFAQAYVIAHEFGHHVQNQLGIADQVAQAQQANPDAANELSVRMELQADCFAGVWAHSVWDQPGEGAVEALEPGDIEEGLTAAAAVGDDRIQAQAGRSINPETWTHGSSDQRTSWFKRGFDQGNAEACDTFADLR